MYKIAALKSTYIDPVNGDAGSIDGIAKLPLELIVPKLTTDVGVAVMFKLPDVVSDPVNVNALILGLNVNEVSVNGACCPDVAPPNNT